MTTSTKHRTTKQEKIQKVNDLIKGIKIAMLTTVNKSDGSLHGRPMSTQQVEFDGDLWFFTQANSPKAAEIAKDQQVNVAYAGDHRWVSVSGTAQILEDKAKMQELWNPIYKVWFPDGLEDPNLRLLKVTVNKAEYWDTPGGTLQTIIGFAEGLLNHDSSKMGENETITLRK
jgi:general stress protein 26